MSGAKPLVGVAMFDAGPISASDHAALEYELADTRARLATADADAAKWVSHANSGWKLANTRTREWQAALADEAALRERVTRAEATIAEIARPNGILCRTCGDTTDACDRDSNPGDECPGKLARAFLAPTEPDGASEPR